MFQTLKFLHVLLLAVTVHSKGLMFQPLDCADIYNDGSKASGVYRIYPAGPNSPRYVYCDMDTDGGKWTVSRLPGRKLFNRVHNQCSDHTRVSLDAAGPH